MVFDDKSRDPNLGDQSTQKPVFKAKAKDLTKHTPPNKNPSAKTRNNPTQAPTRSPSVVNDSRTTTPDIINMETESQ